ncbi:MAG TPA: hypothetical protein PLX83_04130, partial [bacterium]|nr:hypothetical protein [bacterium]
MPAAREGEVVLGLMDDTEMNYQPHSGRLSQDGPYLGPVGNGRDRGFFLHVVLAVTWRPDFPWVFRRSRGGARKWEPDGVRDYKGLPWKRRLDR